MASISALVSQGLALIRTIGDDVRAKAEWTYQGTGTRDLAKALVADGTASVVIYRLMQASRHAGLAPLEMAFNKLDVALGCIIGRGAEFGPGLVLIHSHGVVINGAVRGGSRVLIEHQVTIGAEKGLSPSLGSDVFIGCGAKILGPITVGDGARIGANAVVLHDAPAATTIVGIPAKPVVRREQAAVPPPPNSTTRA